MNIKLVSYDQEVYHSSGVHPTILELIRQSVMVKMVERAPHAKRKWEQPITIKGGSRWAAVLHETADAVTITNVRQLRPANDQPRRGVK